MFAKLDHSRADTLRRHDRSDGSSGGVARRSDHPQLPTVDCVALLSEREVEIARLVSVGLSNKEIGQRLGISHWTVSTHLRRIFIKLEINRRIELCLFINLIGQRATVDS